MTAEVLLWSDYVSPYAFVAKAGAYELERDYDIALQWRPYTLDVASYMGSVDGRDPHHWRRVRYSYMDARRFANKQGLILKGPTEDLLRAAGQCRDALCPAARRVPPLQR